MTYLIDASDVRPLSRAERLRRSGLTDERTFKDNRFVASWDNNFNQDREAMRRRENWSGFRGITYEDAAMTTSMGPIYDRSLEHLVPADAAVVRLRQRLFDSMRLCETGAAPLGVELADLTHMRGFDIDIPEEESWQAHAAQHIEHYPPRAA
jgi:hypothetical protein